MHLARVTSHAGVLLVLGGLPLTTACGAAHGASGPPQASNGSVGSPFHPAATDGRTGSADSLDQALDRVDAARAALNTADAATVKAVRDLDAALDDVSRLSGGSRSERYGAHAATVGVDADRIARRAQEGVDRATAEVERDAVLRPSHVLRIAERQAELAVRRTHIDCECSRDHDAWDDEDHAGDHDAWDHSQDKSWNDAWDDGDGDEDHDGTDRY